MGQQGEIAAGLLDAVDLRELGKDLIGFRRKGHPRAGGHVVENHGQLHPLGNVLIVLDKPGLGGLIVIGRHMQQSICAGILGVLGQVHRGGGVVAPRPGNDLHPAVDPPDAVFHDGDVLPDGQGSALAGGAADADGVHTAGNLLVNQLAEAVVMDSSAVQKGGDDGAAHAGKNGLSHMGDTSLERLDPAPERSGRHTRGCRR